jgi:hypothetical protein
MAMVARNDAHPHTGGCRQIGVEFRRRFESMDRLTKPAPQMQNRGEAVMRRRETGVTGNGGAIAAFRGIQPARVLMLECVLELVLPRHF